MLPTNARLKSICLKHIYEHALLYHKKSVYLIYDLAMHHTVYLLLNNEEELIEKLEKIGLRTKEGKKKRLGKLIMDPVSVMLEKAEIEVRKAGQEDDEEDPVRWGERFALFGTFLGTF